MSLNRLRWAAYYRLRGLRAKAWLWYFIHVRRMNRIDAIVALIRRNTDSSSTIK